jgi:dihydrofolate reductase
MTTLTLDISISLDGYAAAPGVSDADPMGLGGERLHAWALGDDPEGSRIVRETNARVGGTIAGRRTYDRSLSAWGADGPGGADRTPTFVVSHTIPDDVPADGVYAFLTSPQAAVDAARRAAGPRPIDVFSPSVGRQLLAAGSVDELRLHVSPVVFGGGIDLFAGVGELDLELIDARPSRHALHLHYSVHLPDRRSRDAFDSRPGDGLARSDPSA